MPTVEQMRAAVTEYAEKHSACDTDAVVALFSAECVVADPVDAQPMIGREALHAFFGGTHQMAEAFELAITGPIRAVGNWAAVPLHATTTMGGSTFEVDIIDVFTFDEAGLIADMRAYWTAADIVTS